METEELIRQIKSEEIALFGTGFVAERFYMALCQQGLQDQISCCYETAGAGGEFHGTPVYTLDEIARPRDILCCVAVHDALRGEVESALEGKFRRLQWIYPHLWRLIFGAPIREYTVLPLKNILREQTEENFWITLRYALAESWEIGGDATAEEIYCKAQGMFSSQNTVKNRIASFRELYQSMKETGFDAHHPVLIDNEYRIIDGLHRLALAALLGIEQVPCVVYNAKACYDDVLGADNRFTGAVQDTCLSSRQQQFLADAKNRMLTRAGARPDGPSVSVILPVYNVADYIDECMQSLVRQTFRDFEMILINDGSTDDSYEKCMQWAWADGRVRVFDRANGGVASARNFGLEKVRGEWIAFVDPDDWVEDTYLEKLRTALLDAGADFAECDLWRYDNRTGEKTYRSCYGRLGTPYTLREHMKYGPVATYKSMSKRSLWMENGVRIPNCSCESPGVYSLILALSGKVANVRQPLYYYRRFRKGSLIENYSGKDNRLGIESLEFLVGEFKRTGLYDAYKDVLEGVVTYRLSDILALQFYRKAENDFREMVCNYRSFLSRMFPASEKRPYITWGGYNLNRIMTHMCMLHDPYLRFNFSSIIGVMNEDRTDLPKVIHKNKYRQIMVEREFGQRIWTILEEEKPSFIFLDLLEERFDILELDGRYLTISDAFEGHSCAAEMLEKGRRIARNSSECDRLWKDSAVSFFRRICEAVPQEHVFILENYLCEKVGNLEEQQAFQQIEKIRESNRVLKGYYDFLRRRLPDARFFCFTDEPLYFTDERYEYGAIPSHLNELENQRIAERIEAYL